MKTAVIILNHGLPNETDALYESLKPYEGAIYDLMIFDNGSPLEGRAKHTTHLLDRNVYFGGGFNAAMRFVLERPEYDSLLFMNNDLVVYPYKFVESLRNEMFWANGDIAFDIVSPSLYNVMGRMYWKTMHVWGAPYARQVPYVDFQCPLISRRLLSAAKEIDSSLMYGWGICFWFALLCKERNWKIGVSDKNCVLHQNSLTIRKGLVGLDMNQYAKLALEGEADFFSKNNLLPKLVELKNTAENYTYP